MRSYWITTVDGRTVLEPREVAPPRAGPGQIVVRVRAAGLNRGELIVGSVMHGGAGKIGGTEAAGEVHEVGAGVEGWRPGEPIMGRVMGHDRGGFAEFAVMQAHQAMPIPSRLSFVEGAAIPVSFLAAYDAVVAYGGLRAGEWLLVTAAPSSVGVCSVQLGLLLGAKVIGTSGSAAKLGRLKAIGMAAGIATRQPDFVEEVRTLTGGGANLAVNCVGGTLFAACLDALTLGGRLATVGYVDGAYRAEIDLQRLHANRHIVFGISNSRIGEAGHAATTRGFMRDILPAFEAGQITPLIDRTFAFDELPAAKAHMESNAHVGKIVIRMD